MQHILKGLDDVFSYPKCIYFDVFDRRADRTKGATERNKGDAAPTALDFSANLEILFGEKIPNYSSQWKDREYGRKESQLLTVIISNLQRILKRWVYGMEFDISALVE